MRAQFVVSETLIGLRRNLTMTIALIITTALSLALVGAALLMRTQVGNLKDFWYGKIEVSIFLCDPISDTAQCNKTAVSEDQRQAIQTALYANPVVQKVYYESKQDAYKHFLDLFKNSPDLTRNVSPDALPPSFRVKLKDPKRFDVIQSEFQDMPGVDQVADQGKGLKPLFQTFDGLTTAALFGAAITLGASVMLIFNAIRVAAFSRRRETGIMRLVGASKTVIQLPFILEGVIAAVIGAALASGTLWAVAHFFLGEYMSKQYPDTAFISPAQTLLLAPALLGLGASLAGISSLLTLRRYLRV
jgi:cell division transport system permease protein